MTVSSFFRDLYSLDTLDTRFTTSPKTPIKSVNEESKKTLEPKDATALPPGAQPAKWRTPEFYFYALIFVLVVPQMYKSVVDVSLTSSPHYHEYADLLSPGWLFGRKVDNSDGQYSGFRNNLPYLGLLLLFHPLVRKLYERLASPKPSLANGNAKDTRIIGEAGSRLQKRLAFDLVSALVFIGALHGFSIFKILIILTLNFNIAMRLPRQYIPVATWIFNVTILFANELSGGYPVSAVSKLVIPFYTRAQDLGDIIDSYGGLIPRWEVFFKVCILRLISFNMDYYWSLANRRGGSPLEKKQLDPSNLCERDRVSIPASAHMYTSFGTYIAYALYPPLYLAGPILTFNDYISQCAYPLPTIQFRRTVLYGIRFLITLFCMEFLLHTIYVVAISKASPNWSTYTPFQLAMLAYFNLHIVWLKLLLPWRLFRLWSLIDGIDPPENMLRCMSDNYSTAAFWRAWHRSYYKWTIRYVYVPLGGGPGGGTSTVRGIVNMLMVFTFVALWHDINLRLLMWGWLVVLFVLPEIVATFAFPKKKWESRATMYRMLCAIGATFNILMMMAANLVGFALGMDGLKGLIAGIANSWQGAVFMLGAMSALFIGSQVMFEHREEEKRKGVVLKC